MRPNPCGAEAEDERWDPVIAAFICVGAGLVVSDMASLLGLNLAILRRDLTLLYG